MVRDFIFEIKASNKNGVREYNLILPASRTYNEHGEVVCKHTICGKELPDGTDVYSKTVGLDHKLPQKEQEWLKGQLENIIKHICSTK